MPIAIAMNHPTPTLHAPSPTSPRMTKAAFFRARSPPALDRSSATGTARAHSPNDLAARLHQMELNTAPPHNAAAGPSRGFSPASPSDEDGGYEEVRDQDHHHGMGGLRVDHAMPMANGSGHRANGYGHEGYASSVGTLGHTPEMGHTAGVPYDQPEASEGRSPGASGPMGMGGGSDEMVMSLLAGQAVVDCETMVVGGWEEVESWKKELAVLKNRLDALVARHQREVKILTAARTLQKLNHTNKRMSKQTTESLEQAEKRVEAAEREVLTLKEREADLRRRLMEHWSGVMAWEVRRLEKVSSDTQARFHRQSRHVDMSKDREAKLLKQMGELETECEQRLARIQELDGELHRRGGREKELQEMVVDLGRRERGMEEELRAVDKVKRGLEMEKEGWELQRRAVERDGGAFEAEKREWAKEREEWASHKRLLAEEMERLMKDRQKMLDAGKTSERDKAVMQGVRARVGEVLGRQTPAEHELEAAIKEMGALVQRRENEVASLREEMKEVNMGLEEELRRVSADRDNWKGKADQVEQGYKGDMAAIERKARGQAEQISDLTLRNETLASSLAAAQSAVTSMSSSSTQTKALQTRCDALTAELDSIAGQFNEVWTILPPLSRRVDAQLARPDGTSADGVSSPTKSLNFAALQQLYTPTREEFGGIDEMLERVRGLVEDGKVLVARVVRLGQEREMYKSNAAKAKKLVEDSRGSLETYQQQVAVLEDRLAKSGSTESHFLEELNTLRSALDTAQIAKRQAESRLKSTAETVARLEAANADLSTRALTLAEDAEDQRSALVKKTQAEIQDLKRQVGEVQGEADEERMRGQTQRIQLLDELNSLQAEVGDLRKQLRMAKGGTPAK